ncbi:MAG: response regulator [Leptospiraceae bacterium]|nr:response regulator [Leptospiraceae bacterium]
MKEIIHIMLVEDNIDFIHSIKRILSDEKFKITNFESGREAFEYLENPKEIPDVILLDYQLPEMNGIEILEQINSKENDYSFIFLSVFNSFEIVLKAMKAGALDFLVKTNSLGEELPDKIEKIYKIHKMKIEKKKMEKELIEARKKAEESEERYKRLFINSMSLIIELETESLKIISCNPRMAKYLNKSVEEIEGKYIKDLLPDEVFKTRYSYLKKSIDENIILEFEDENNGFYFFNTIIPIINDENKSAQIVAYDITERKKSEVKIKKQNEELIKLVSDKDRFMQILAHDLRNPFSGIIGLSKTIADDLSEMEGLSEIHEQILLIYKESKKAHRLMEDLLLWSKAQSGKLPFEPRKNNLKDILRAEIDEMENLASQKNIKINLLMNGIETVFFDKNMIRTVVRNFLSNAIKFSYKGGEVNLVAILEGDNIKITIQDFGVGISDEIKLKLWDVSNPYSSRGTNNEKGSGLGLFICKEFVENHAGKIWIESEPGKGSKFIFTIPS